MSHVPHGCADPCWQFDLGDGLPGSTTGTTHPLPTFLPSFPYRSQLGASQSPQDYYGEVVLLASVTSTSVDLGYK
jgi:hypothetical protein